MIQNQEIVFEINITGNPTDISGSALPKVKLTRNQQWTPRAQKYAEWKSFLLKHFLDQTKKHEARSMIERNTILYGKPLVTSRDVRGVMDIDILWKDERHGDAENVFGSIADAFFKQDKYLDGSFKSNLSKDKTGSVKIRIKLLCHL